MSALLSGLTIGALTLTPTFDKNVKEYTATTTSATNKITATPEDENATIVITVGETEVENGSAATWEEGENTVTIEVTNWLSDETYTVTVTKGS